MCVVCSTGPNGQVRYLILASRSIFDSIYLLNENRMKNIYSYKFK